MVNESYQTIHQFMGGFLKWLAADTKENVTLKPSSNAGAMTEKSNGNYDVVQPSDFKDMKVIYNTHTEQGENQVLLCKNAKFAMDHQLEYVEQNNSCLSTIGVWFCSKRLNRVSLREPSEMPLHETILSKKSVQEEYKSEEHWEIPLVGITNLSYIGAGAQGVVYRGVLGCQMVAVKKLSHKSDIDVEVRKLNHKNIVQFIGVSTEDPNYCVIMEYCQYGSLYDLMHKYDEGGIDPAKVLKWSKETAEGMNYLHSKNIIHRDLKSPNILVGRDLIAKVSDFGASREWTSASTVMSFNGTVAWMAPEIIRNERCSDRIDVWSFGVVLWELLTNMEPYADLERNAIMWGVATKTLSLHIPAGCPKLIRDLLIGCWDSAPKNRPSFAEITVKLNAASEYFTCALKEDFAATQRQWRSEIAQAMKVKPQSMRTNPEERTVKQRDALRQARELCSIYERQVTQANKMYMDMLAARLQLEAREKALAEREKECRCYGWRATLQQARLASSTTSSDQTPRVTLGKGVPTPPPP